VSEHREAIQGLELIGAGETGGNPDEEGADKDKVLQIVPDHI